MESNAIAATGYATSMLTFAATSILFFGRWKSSAYSRELGLVCGVSSVWGCMLTFHSLGYVAFNLVVAATEWTRYAFWIAALFLVLRTLDSQRLAEKYARRFGIPLVLIAIVALTNYSRNSLDSLAESLVVSGGIVAALSIVGLLEQIYRNLPSDSTSGFKYVCVALFVVSVYDIGLLARAISVSAIETDLWAARGFVVALVIVPMILFARRSAVEGATDIPRQVLFYSFSLLAIGISIVLWLMADFYLREFGGTWGNVAGIVIAAAAFSALGILLVSATIRARVRVFLTKAFFQYKYDYRKEWLRFIGTLSESGLEHVPTTSVRAVAPIVNSPGGIVWTREHDGDKYLPVGVWRSELPIGRSFDKDSSLVRFLQDNQWIIDLNEMKSYPSRYEGLELDDWFTARDDFWLVVPMLVGKRLFGFIVLLKPRSVPALNFEDHDLLRTVGRHAGTHIKQAESDRRLAETSQFGTYHRLSAFLMHDLNNLIAQQSLVVKNAEKFRHDPQFVDDTINTIAHSVTRMRRLMEQLSSVTKTPQSTKVSLPDALQTAVRNSRAREPVPTLSFETRELFVKADAERLTVVFEHLIRNAQDATEKDGAITITAGRQDSLARIVISDTGCGMSPEFVSQRLFRPFDSTKGSQSMGIGVYQAREYMGMLGGQLEVESTVGQGTTFSLRLPIAD
jgi:putative PEP-CTERM system histidine kinase